MQDYRQQLAVLQLGMEFLFLSRPEARTRKSQMWGQLRRTFTRWDRTDRFTQML